LAPVPWASDLIASDPTFNNCGSTDGTCRMAWFETISGSSDLFLYNGMVWAFFNNGSSCSGDYCQQNAVDISSSSSLYIYGQNVKAVTNVFVEGSSAVASETANEGGWGGVVAAYLRDS
jgi:glucan 1,3-beta-glucosidase